jgi:hypothetical protein
MTTELLSRIDLCIMDSMADDLESILQIEPAIKEDCPSLTRDDLINRLILLVQHGLVLVKAEEPFTKVNVLRDLESCESCPGFSFGMTEYGAGVWERSAEKYGLKLRNWDDVCPTGLFFEKGVGYVVATSTGRTLEEFSRMDDPRIIIDKDSIQYSEITYREKYYRPMRAGWMLKFRFKNSE